MSWDNLTLSEPWTVSEDVSGVTLSAVFYAPYKDGRGNPAQATFPVRYDRLPQSGLSAPPAAYRLYVVDTIEATLLTPAGPWQVAVRASRMGYGFSSRKTLRQEHSVAVTYSDYSIDPSNYMYLAELAGCSLDDGDDSLAKALAKLNGNEPFPLAHRFLSASTVHHIRYSDHTMETWGTFSGITPVRAVPSWLTLPGGDNRWRLVDERLEEVTDNDGKTRLLKVSRTLLGIANSCALKGRRCTWNQSLVGQRNWDDIEGGY